MDYLMGKMYWLIGTFPLLLLIPVLTGNEYLKGICILMFIYVSLSISWNIISGITGQFSFGHAIFFGLGAYLSGLLSVNYHITPWLGMLVAGLVSILVSMLIGSFCFKLKGIYFALATFCFSLILEILSRHFKFTGGDVGLQIPISPGNSFLDMQFSNTSVYYYIILVLAMLFFCISAVIYHSKLGYYLRSIRDDEVAAESLGIPTKALKLLSYGISAFMASIIGTFYIQYTLFIDPHTAFGFSQIVQIMLPTNIGGIGTLMGPVIGAVFSVGLTQGINAVTSTFALTRAGLDLIIYSVIVILVISIFPKGLISIPAVIRNLFTKKRPHHEYKALQEQEGEPS